MSRTDYVLSQLPDPDDALRRLADVLQVPEKCRKRACRRDRCCQGGLGPPCYFAHRSFFADAVRDRMHEFRDHWAEERETLRAMLRQ